MKSSAKKVELAPYDDLFSTEESRQDRLLLSRKRSIDILRFVRSDAGPGELGPDDIPYHLFKRQAVPLIHGKHKRREHDGQHEEHGPGAADRAPGQQIDRDAYQRRAAETDQLALG